MWSYYDWVVVVVVRQETQYVVVLIMFRFIVFRQ